MERSNIRSKVIIPTKLNDKQRDLLKQFSKESGEDVHESKKGFFDKVKDALGG